MNIFPERLVNLFGASAVGTTDRMKNVTFDTTVPGGGETTAAIVVIGHATSLSINELRRVLGLFHAGTLRPVDRSVAAGLVVRSRTLRDRRAAARILTEAGGDRMPEILQRRNRTLFELLSNASNADRPFWNALPTQCLGVCLTTLFCR